MTAYICEIESSLVMSPAPAFMSVLTYPGWKGTTVKSSCEQKKEVSQQIKRSGKRVLRQTEASSRLSLTNHMFTAALLTPSVTRV